MDQFEADFSDIQWDRLLKRLTACAAKWFLQEDCFEPESVLPATGKSAKDLAFDTVAAFIKGNIKWKPKSTESAERDLYVLLKKVMLNDFLDLVKPGRAYKRTAVLDPSNDGEEGSGEYNSAPTLASLPADPEKELYSINAAIVGRRILPLVDGDRHLIDYVNAVLVGGCLKTQDIAAYLRISQQEVNNRKRRLRTRLASWRRSVEKGAAASQ